MTKNESMNECMNSWRIYVWKTFRIVYSLDTVFPFAGYAKYMSLAQLVEGEESVKHFKKGIELMESLKDKIIKGEDEDEQELQGAGALPSTSPMAKLEDLQSDISRGNVPINQCTDSYTWLLSLWIRVLEWLFAMMFIVERCRGIIKTIKWKQ